MPEKNIKRWRNQCPVPTGILVLIGGAENRSPEKEDAAGGINIGVLEAFVKLLNKRKPHIEVVTSASSQASGESFSEYERSFKNLGARTVSHIHHDERGQISLADLKDRLYAADGVFFSGGDQLKLTALYGGTDFLMVLKQRYIFDGLVIAGTSAGAMAMSTPMIYRGVGRDEMVNGNVKITTGLEFMRDVCVDTHFVDRGRFVRMCEVIATNPGCIGIGIEEDTAIIVKKGTDLEVSGNGVVIFIHGRNSKSTNITQTEDLLTIRGLEVDILSNGQTFQIPEINPPHK